jgi:hypothetical protein
LPTTSTPLQLTKRYINSVTYDLDGCTLDEAIEFFRNQEKYISSIFPDVVKIELSYDPVPWEDRYELNIIGFAPENDKERKTREDKEFAYKKQCEAYERKQYEKLKKKFK